MNWHNLWFDPGNNRLRCGWRVISYICLATFFSMLIASLLLVFVQRIFPHSLQLKNDCIELLLRIVVIVVLISMGVWALRNFEHLPARTLGVSLRGRWAQTLAIGFSIGIGIITLLLLVLRTLGYASFNWHHPTQSAIGMLVLLIFGMLIVAMSEEMIFHGYLFQTLLRGIGPLATLFITSTVFALFHLPNTSQLHLLGLVNIGMAGLLFGLLYLRQGTLWMVIGVHAGWDFAQLLFGLPSSGITFPLVTPITVKLAFIPWLTGGEYGLEGGVGISVLLLGLLAIVTYARRGLSFESRWWEWRELSKALTPALPWDFTVDGRYYQWKLLGNSEE